MTVAPERSGGTFENSEIPEAVSFGSQGWLYQLVVGHSRTGISRLGMIEE